MSWRCLIGLHDTAIGCGETLAVCACRACGQLEQSWRVIRPECENKAARERAQFWAWVERRPTTVVPFTRRSA